MTPGPPLMLSTVYSALARGRRRWFDRHPEARRRLARPVVSVGNLAVGGSGKTPTVACLAQILSAAGERPVVLSRGYARRVRREGVVVVQDRERMRAGLDEAGDEPLMLARQLERVPVLVSSDRQLAGVLGERHFDASVHLLDDGFQHMMLERDVDLVLVDTRDVAEPRTLPGGRLREPLDTLVRADAVLVTGDAAAVADRLAALGAPRLFRLSRRLGAPRWIDPDAGPVPDQAAARVLAVAGVARPERFVADLRTAGWDVAGDLTFRDHHRYRPPDIQRIARRAAELGAGLILTTEKDLVRLLPLAPLAAPIAWVPLSVAVEPEAAFQSWLVERLAKARAERRLRR